MNHGHTLLMVKYTSVSVHVIYLSIYSYHWKYYVRSDGKIITSFFVNTNVSTDTQVVPQMVSLTE